MNISRNLKNKFFSKELAISLAVAILVFILDRASKVGIINQQIVNKTIFVNDYLNFELVWNTGISFGLFSQNANIYYHLISLLIFSVIIYLIYLIIKADFVDFASKNSEVFLIVKPKRNMYLKNLSGDFHLSKYDWLYNYKV